MMRLTLCSAIRCLVPAKLIPSIFNDVIGPVMRGPSSSHSAASVRIGTLVHDLLGGQPDWVEIDYDTQGSLANTHESQGTDMGLYAGFMGWSADDARLPRAPTVIRHSGTSITVRKAALNDPHPNTYRINASRGGIHHSLVALSTGGGMIEVIEIDEVPVSLFADYATTLVWMSSIPEATLASLEARNEIDEVSVFGNGPWWVAIKGQTTLDDEQLASLGIKGVRHALRRLLPVGSRAGLAVPFVDSSELGPLASLDTLPLSDWALEYECARGGIDQGEVLEQSDRMLNIMRKGVQTGLAGTDYQDRILGWQSGRYVELERQGKLLGDGLTHRMTAYVTALMEAKSAMEVIVAAPTAGSCATFPGALLAAIDELECSEAVARRALLTGGLIGVFVANRSSFAAEMGGCQAETGAGAAMAAAALVELGGGSAAQSLSAASQAIQNVLGLICDPVGNRVEAPCLGRNVAGAANALVCANMALAGYDHVVPLDQVLDAHRNVSELMARELRCTGLGGLAITPAARAVEIKLSEIGRV